jgi:hypothetical protein
MKPTTKIRFTEPQIALVMRAHPGCNLGHLTELSFEFDRAGEIVDCTGTIRDGGNIDHNYAGSGLALLYERARRQFTALNPAQRFCNSQMVRGLPRVLLNAVVLGHQPPYQADRPRCARDIRGRIGLALDCRSGPGPRTVRCKARSSSDQGLQGSTVVDLDQGNRH